MYYDDLNQVVDLRNLITGSLTPLTSPVVGRPTLSLGGQGNNTAAQTFTAAQAISQARMLEDVSVTAFTGALTYLTGANLALATQCLAISGMHASALRLISIQTAYALSKDADRYHPPGGNPDRQHGGHRHQHSLRQHTQRREHTGHRHSCRYDDRLPVEQGQRDIRRHRNQRQQCSHSRNVRLPGGDRAAPLWHRNPDQLGHHKCRRQHSHDGDGSGTAATPPHPARPRLPASPSPAATSSIRCRASVQSSSVRPSPELTSPPTLPSQRRELLTSTGNTITMSNPATASSLLASLYRQCHLGQLRRYCHYVTGHQRVHCRTSHSRQPVYLPVLPYWDRVPALYPASSLPAVRPSRMCRAPPDS